MHSNILLVAIASLALTNANPHMMKRYGNETMSAFSTTGIDAKTETMPTFTSTAPVTPGLTETIPSVLPSSSIETQSAISPINSTYDGNAVGPIVTSSEVVQVTTSVNTATLTYTLGPEGASSVVTTTVESTSTISMTVTIYNTVTQYGNLASSVLAEPTTTTTSYFTTTKTITLQSVEASNAAVPSSDSGAGSFFQSEGANFGNSNSGVNSGVNSGANSGSNLGSSADGACGVTTVTATIVERSTVTVTPTATSSAENVPVAPTVTPSYGFGNGTDPSTPKYGTASSGFLTLHQPRPTGI